MKKLFGKIEIFNDYFSTMFYSVLSVELFYSAALKGSVGLLVLSGMAAIPALYFFFVDTNE